MNRRNIFSLSAITGLGLASTAILGMLSGAAYAQTAKDLVGTWQYVSSVNTALTARRPNLLAGIQPAWRFLRQMATT